MKWVREIDEQVIGKVTPYYDPHTEKTYYEATGGTDEAGNMVVLRCKICQGCVGFFDKFCRMCGRALESFK